MEVLYESRPRQFCVDSIAVQSPVVGDPVASITEEVKSLSLDSKSLLWTTGWDTSVCILENNADHQVDYPHKVCCYGTLHCRNLDNAFHACVPFQPEIETLEQAAPADAYTAVGGLDKTIAEIRDLIEIPLTRPELFAHFGESCVENAHDSTYLP